MLRLSTLVPILLLVATSSVPEARAIGRPWTPAPLDDSGCAVILGAPGNRRMQVEDRSPRVERWLGQMPKMRAGGGSLFRKEFYAAFLMGLEDVDLLPGRSISVAFDGQVREYVIAPWLLDAWKKLGLIGADNRFNFDSTLSEIRARFFQLSGFSSSDEARLLGHATYWAEISAHRMPFADIHEVFFHLPFFVDATSREVMLLAARFVALEASVSPLKQPVSQSVLNAIYEGNYGTRVAGNGPILIDATGMVDFWNGQNARLTREPLPDLDAFWDEATSRFRREISLDPTGATFRYPELPHGWIGGYGDQPRELRHLLAFMESVAERWQELLSARTDRRDVLTSLRSFLAAVRAVH